MTLFAVKATNNGSGTNYFFIDYAFADPGPSEIEAFDGDRIIDIYPKFYPGSYVGNGQSSNTVTFARKGTPAMILLSRNGGTNLYFWIKGMTSGYCHEIGATNAWITTGITDVAEGGFYVGSTINASDQTYVYGVLFED